MYFRPASSAQFTASASGCFERTLASFTSIGRFTPAITSTPCRCIMEIARLDGVPPNMSVSSTTPSPVSHRPIQASISARRLSMSSSGPMQTVSTFRCEPDHVLHGGSQFLGQAAVGHQDHADHWW